MKIIGRFLSCMVICFAGCIWVSAQSAGLKWDKSGNSFYVNENKGIVKYGLPSFNKTVVADSQLLIPAGKNKPLVIRDFFFSEDGKKILIYTNSKKVWRRDTRGDYWVLDLQNKSLWQLGKGKPSSSLMFAKISPDNTKAAYVSGHNIYMEDLATHKITALTRDGTTRLINGTFDWVYEEEFSCRDGFRWSPDSKSIAYWQIDASGIKNFLIPIPFILSWFRWNILRWARTLPPVRWEW
jgi:dipeptidyl-peptidase-4